MSCGNSLNENVHIIFVTEIFFKVSVRFTIANRNKNNMQYIVVQTLDYILDDFSELGKPLIFFQVQFSKRTE